MFVDIPDSGPYYIRVDQHDTWSADQTMAMVIAPVIRQMAARKMGIPSTFLPTDCYDNQFTFDFLDNAAARQAEEDRAKALWFSMLDDMARAFERVADGMVGCHLTERRAIQQAIHNFATNYFHFWD